MSHRSRSSRRRQPRAPIRRGLLLSLGVVATAAAAVLLVRAPATDDGPAADARPVPEAIVARLSDEGAFEGGLLHGTRPVYPHSIVAGGIYSRQELRAAIATDPVVAAHYTDIQPDAARIERVSEPRRVYMSYRVGDQVYWTKKKVALRPGEAIVTDGQSAIRARCGNCISDVPMAPVAAEEPSVEEFDRAIVPPFAPIAGLNGAEPALAVIPSPLLAGAPLGGAPPATFAALGPALGVPGTGFGAPAIAGGLPPRLAVPGDPGPDSPGNPSTPEIPGTPQTPETPQTPQTPFDPPLFPDVPLIPGVPPIAPEVPILPPTEPQPVPVPEPGSLLLVGTGIAGYALRRLRKGAQS